MAPTPLTPKVPSLTFAGVLWGGTAISLGFFVFRVAVRIKYFRRVYADDFLVLGAWLMLLASAVIWQTQLDAAYTQFDLASGLAVPTPEVLEAEKTFLRFQVAILFLFYSSLWSVKLGVLIFFRRLGQKVRGQKIWWWVVLAFTLATYATCIGNIQYPCLLRSLEFIFSQCSSGHQLDFQWRTLQYNCAVDVITDTMIITIPIFMLWNVRISLRHKLALMGIFSLTIIVIVFSIVRVSVVTSESHQADITWLYMWSNIEMAISVTVACLASFRQLFVKSESSSGFKRQSDANHTSSWSKVLLSSLRSFKPHKSLPSSAEEKGSWSDGAALASSRQPTTRDHNDSTEHFVVPTDNIYVTKKFSMVHSQN